MTRKLIKVCGLTDAANIRAVEALGADFVGFIFYPPSPRCAPDTPPDLPAGKPRVGVFVNAPAEEILRRRKAYGLTFAQLHGDESPAFCRELRKEMPVIKAFGVGAELPDTASWEGVCDYFLFDTKTAAWGGSGRSFNWTVLDTYQGRTPFLLGGGIGPESAEVLAGLRHPLLAGFDLNSRFESAPGMKDISKLEPFFKKIRK